MGCGLHGAANYLRTKRQADIPGLSWRELWFMTHAQGGFGLEDFVNYGFSLEGTVLNPFLYQY